MAEPTSPRCPATNTLEVACTCAPLAAELDSKKSRHRHSKQNGAVTETPDIRHSVRTRPVIHGNVDYTGTKYSSRKEQFEIAERVEVAKVAPPSDEALIITARHELRTA